MLRLIERTGSVQTRVLDLSLALLGGLVVAGARVVPLPLPVLPPVAAISALVPALVPALVLAPVFLVRASVLLIGALVARLMLLK